MASIFDTYGIKEVCNVAFYKILDNGTAGEPVLYLDTLKVTTVEQTAQEATANGGKGNARLISWDHTKELNVTIEDALFSPKSMALTWGGANKAIDTVTSVLRTGIYTATTNGALPTKGIVLQDGSISFDSTEAASGATVTWYNAAGSSVTSGTKDEKYLGKFNQAVATGSGHVITVDAQNFPGTYYVVGDTWARRADTGEDEFFQLVFYKAKVSPENSITLQADGDPSVFNMNLTLLKNVDGKFMDLIQYKI